MTQYVIACAVVVGLTSIGSFIGCLIYAGLKFLLNRRHQRKTEPDLDFSVYPLPAPAMERILASEIFKSERSSLLRYINDLMCEFVCTHDGAEPTHLHFAAGRENEIAMLSNQPIDPQLQLELDVGYKEYRRVFATVDDITKGRLLGMTVLFDTDGQTYVDRVEAT